jgi:hypothetical protein
LLSYADQYDEHRKSLTTAGAYIRVPDGEPNEVCKQGGAVWVGFAPLNSGDAENVLPRFRWRFTKTRDMVRISSVFCEGIGEYVLSPEGTPPFYGSPIVLKEWDNFSKYQTWFNHFPTNAVRQFSQPFSSFDYFIEVPKDPKCIVYELNGGYVPSKCRLHTYHNPTPVRLPAICLVPLPCARISRDCPNLFESFIFAFLPGNAMGAT